MVKLDFGGVKEDVITRKEFTVEQAQKILKDEVIVSLGYGIQGRAQSLNMRDNGVKVIIGQENTGVHKAYYDLAVQDGWVPGKTLFSMEEAAKRGTIKMFLLTDAGQRDMWPAVKKTLKEGDALYFSHGFSIVYSGMTGVVPPKNVDVILVAPKGSGTSVRRNFLGWQRHKQQLRRSPKLHWQSRGPNESHRNRNRLRLPVSNHVREGSLQ